MATTYFKKADFLPVVEEDRKAKLLYYVTADLAISEAERADYSVFLVAGVDENKVIHIKNVIRERMDGREIVDTLLALQRLYEPVAVGIEDMQVSKSIGPFLREEMIKSNTFLTLYPMKHGGKDKLTRSRSIQARMRAKGIKFAKDEDWYPEFEEELLRFPRAKHDDQVDTFAYLGLMLDKLIEAPTQKEQDDEDYLEEMRKSDMEDTGRNASTGY
jgi:predicted phage terminase large subunit-like protein